MSAPDRSKIHNPSGDQYPDNNDSKELFFQAIGRETADDGVDRHVLIRWVNGKDGDTRHTQIIQLSGGPGNYAFHHPSVKPQSTTSLHTNTFYSLGTFTRAQRDQIIALALAVKFERTSRVNSCRTWARDLLEAMVGVNLISQRKFNKIDQGIPLKKRVPELVDSDDEPI